MASFVSRLVACLVAVVALLQLTHLVLLNKLESRRLTEIQHLHHMDISSSAQAKQQAGRVLSPPAQRHYSLENAEISGRQRRSQKQRSHLQQQQTHINLRELESADSSGEFRIISNVEQAVMTMLSKHHQESRRRQPMQLKQRNQVISHLLTHNHGRHNTSSYNYENDEINQVEKRKQEKNSSSTSSFSASALVVDNDMIVDGDGDFGLSENNNVKLNYESAQSTRTRSSSTSSSTSTDVTIVVVVSDLTHVRRHLITLIERWKGPISLAIFAQSTVEINRTIEYVQDAIHCHPLIKQHVMFHLVFPITLKFRIADLIVNVIKESDNDNDKLQSNGRCQSFYNNNQNMMPYIQQHWPNLLSSSTSSAQFLKNYTSSFPINLLRNIARAKVKTRFSFVIDIDMLPSTELRPKFMKFINQQQAHHQYQYSPSPSRGAKKRRRADNLIKTTATANDYTASKTVYVVPAFESKNGEIPENKEELLKLLETYQARPFYFDLCWKCQAQTDYESWQRETPSTKSDLSVLYEVLWKDPWEPFFISINHDVPLYDSRFRNEYGYNRLSQLCELHMTGYKFAILNDGFLIHPQFKTTEASSYASSSSSSSSTQYYSEIRNYGLEINRAHFRQFKVEMKDKYPQSSRSCY